MRRREMIAALLVLVLAGPTFAQPLPPGAMARLGSLRLRAPAEVLGLAFSPDGKRLVSRTTSGMQVWDAANGRQLWHANELHHRCDTVCFLAKGRYAVTSCYVEQVGVWDVEKGEQVRTFPLPNKRVVGVSGAPGGTVFAMATQDGEIHVGDAAQDHSLQLLTRTGIDNTVTAVSPDSRLLAIAAPQTDIELWDLHLLVQVRSLAGRGIIRQLAVRNDKTLVVATDKQIVLVDAAGNTLREFLPHVANPVALWISEDGKRLAVAGQHAPTVVRAWDMASGKIVYDFKDPRSTRVTAIAPDGRTVALSFWDQRIELWHADTGKPCLTTDGHGKLVEHLTFLPDGLHVATVTSDKQACVWDLSGKLCRSFQHGDPNLYAAHHCFAAGGRFLFTHESPSDIAVWDLATGKARSYKVPTKEPFELRDVAETGETVVLRTTDSVLLWDLGASSFRLTIKPLHFPNMAVLSPDQRWLFIRETVYTKLWDARTGKAVRQIAVGDSQWVFQAFTPDGRQLVLAFARREDKVWSSPLEWSAVETGELLATVPVPDYVYSGSVFSPDARLLATAAMDGGITLYEMRTRLPLWKIATPKAANGGARQVGGMAFSPDGRRLAAAVADTSVLVFDLDALLPDMAARVKQLTPAGREQLWADLAAKGEDVFRAMAVLTAAGAETVAFLKGRLQPVPVVSEERLARLLDELDAPQFARREAASKELLQLGDVAEPALRKLLASRPSLETNRRVELLLKRLDERFTRFPSAAVRVERAVWVLERIGTPEARAVLETLARGDARSGQTRQARQALVRLAERKG